MRIWTILCLCLLALPAEAKVEVIDGDSLIINGREVRLEGIDAPEYYQKCYNAEGKSYRCGKRARKELVKLVENGVECKKCSVDRYKREVSVCYAGKIDVNQEMVARGWAVAYTRYFDKYADDEFEAKKHKRGIWSGKFMKPELWRAIRREKRKESQK